jgi:hypothetical protein
VAVVEVQELALLVLEALAVAVMVVELMLELKEQ